MTRHAKTWGDIFWKWVLAGSDRSDAAYRADAWEARQFPQPSRNEGGKPCGECHLHPGETCDICGSAS